jgi:hypothetical protein
LSEFTSEFELFNSVVDPGGSWSSVDSVLDGTDFDSASTWDQFGVGMEMYNPLIPVPGGLPVLSGIVINDLQIQIRWRRGGNTLSGGAVYLEDFNVGGGALPAPEYFRSTTPNEAFHTDQTGGDAAFWLTTNQGLKDFIDGTNPFDFNLRTASINGSTQTFIAWVKAQIQYTYTGSGIGFPKLF